MDRNLYRIVMVFNDFLDKFLRMTLWIWLPFYVLPMLFREVMEHRKKKSGI